MRDSLLTLSTPTLVLLLATSVSAQSPLSIEGGVAYYSSYAWRGYEVTRAASVQPSLTFASAEHGVWFDVWGAFASNDREQWRETDEVDLTLGYDHHFELGLNDISMSVGYVHYAFPRLEGTASSTQEVFAAIGVDTFLQPSLNLFYDFDLVDAWYINPSLSHSLWLGPAIGPTLDLTASVGFTDALYDDAGEAGFGWQDVTLGASMDFAVGSVVFSPHLGYAFADASINEDESLFWGGGRIGFGF